MMRLRYYGKIPIAFTISFFLIGGDLCSSEGAGSLPDFSDLAEKMAPIVVNISTTQTAVPAQPQVPAPFGEPDP